MHTHIHTYNLSEKHIYIHTYIHTYIYMQGRLEALNKTKGDLSEKLAVLEAEYRTYKTFCESTTPNVSNVTPTAFDQ